MVWSTDWRKDVVFEEVRRLKESQDNCTRDLAGRLLGLIKKYPAIIIKNNRELVDKFHQNDNRIKSGFRFNWKYFK